MGQLTRTDHNPWRRAIPLVLVVWIGFLAVLYLDDAAMRMVQSDEEPAAFTPNLMTADPPSVMDLTHPPGQWRARVWCTVRGFRIERGELPPGMEIAGWTSAPSDEVPPAAIKEGSSTIVFAACADEVIILQEGGQG